MIGPLPGGAACTNPAGCYWMYWPNVHMPQTYSGGGTGVAVSPGSPAGPWTDVTPGGEPLLPGEDPTVFRDPDTGAVFLCGNPGTAPRCGRLAADMVSLEPGSVLNLTSVPHWFEAPWLQKMASGVWLLSYMCKVGAGVGHYGFDICQAVCSGAACPLSDTWAFVDAPLQWNPPFDCDTPLGCGDGGGNNAHHGTFAVGGRWYLAYHTRLLAARNGRPSAGLQRNIALDAAYTDAATSHSTFLPVAATPGWLRPLHFVDPYAAPLPGALTAGASPGVDSAPVADAGSPGVARAVVFPAGAASWTRVSNVDFGAPPRGAAPPTQTLTVRVAGVGGTGAPGTAVGVVLTLDGPPGAAASTPPLAVCPVPDQRQAAPGAWVTVTCHLGAGGAWGVRDAFLSIAATQPGAQAVALAWWQAAGGAASGAAPPPTVVPCDGVRAKANGRLLASPAGGGAGAVAASAAAASPATAMRLVDNEDGSWALQSAALGSYLCATGGVGTPVTAAAPAPDAPCARLRLTGTTDGSYALFALATSGGPLALAVDPSSGALAPTAADPRNATADGARFWLSCGAPLRA